MEGPLPSFASCLALEQFYCFNNQFTGAYSRVSTDRSVVPVLQTVVFCLLKTDWIRAFCAGALPSFAECKQLGELRCGDNQFTGTQVR